MAWSDDAWKEIETVYQKILDSKFVSELGDGTLASDRFIRYMQQDKLYLNDYARALSLVAARAYETRDTIQFAKFTQVCAEAEQELHNFYLDFHKNNGINTTDMSHVKKNIACELYTSFLIRHATISPVEVAAAAVLPCFWIYDAVGLHHRQKLKEVLAAGKEHPYVRWIEMYSSEDFTSGTKEAREFVDRLAANTTPQCRQAMTEAFVKTSVMELMFWQAAYDDEQWIV
jgi:thiaminase (transcriptional activator TenA)